MMAKRLLAVIGALVIAATMSFGQSTQSGQSTSSGSTDQSSTSTTTTTTKTKKHRNKKSADNATDNSSDATGATGSSSSKASSSTSTGGSGAMSSSASAGTGDVSGSDRVWVNKDTKIYHRQGDRWYGKTKNGEYMSESEAQKEGYRPAKTHSKPSSQQ